SANHDAPLPMLWRELLVGALPPASERAAELDRFGLIPEGFDAWFAMCLERTPGLRPQNAREALEGLNAVFASAGVPASPRTGATSGELLSALSSVPARPAAGRSAA